MKPSEAYSLQTATNMLMIASSPLKKNYIPMKKYLLLVVLLLSATIAFAQPAKKPKQTTPPAAMPNMDKMMQEAMKGMSKEEQEEMKKMMGSAMSKLTQSNNMPVNYPDFSSNSELVPKKNAVRIASIPMKKLAQTDMAGYTTNLFNKLITKGATAEITLAKSVIAKNPSANDLQNAAVLAMMQGHPEAAMAFIMKAVQLEPANVNMQNNMAALFTQYGYPEQALPILNKLKAQFPSNSTVLNNLCMAWFGLGELDSAQKFARLAIRANPYHPETKVCGGLMDELKGDPIKAIKEYTEAMENSPNELIQKILKNANGAQALENIDFDKLKRSITIYEYFPKDWIKVPTLSDNISGFENDSKMKNGNSAMFTDLDEKIESLLEASSAEIRDLAEKNMGAFVGEAMGETMKGVNITSKTAVIVQLLLQLHMAKWTDDYTKELADLQNMINTKRSEMTKSGDNDKCADIDKKNNNYLAYINPIIREFHAKKIEEFRNWLNAHCTWAWHVAGNPKNTVMTSCIGWTSTLIGLYKEAITSQEAIAKSCVETKSDGTTLVPTPEIPNFKCPTLVKIPFGKDWQDLSNATKNFDANSLGIKSKSSPIPNNTTAYGGDDNSIAQPGPAPYTKTTNGSVASGGEEELTPLSKIPADELTPLPDLRRNKLLKELLKKMMTADCKDVKSPKEKLKEALDKMMEKVNEMDKAELQKIKQNGIQPSISNGVQVPGAISPVKGLFQ